MNVVRTRPPRRPAFLGPATLLALLVALGILAAGRSGSFAPQGPAPVLPPSRTGARPAPLWKPEPGLLLRRSADLGLRTDQTRAITALDAAWSAERRQREREMQAAADRAKPAGAGSLEQISSGLQEYSALSREYDTRRADYWQQAISLLTPAQRATLHPNGNRAERAHP